MDRPVDTSEQLYQLGQIITVIKMYHLEKMTPDFDQRCSLDNYLKQQLSISEYLLWRGLHESGEKVVAIA